MKITIKDVARMANVSISTVSRVINNSQTVNSEIRKRVLDVLEATQFRPNAIARTLVKNNTSLIGVLLPEIKNNVLDDMVEGINQVAHLYGFDVMIALSGGNPDSEMHYYNLFREMQASGIIISASGIRDSLFELIEAAGIPCILVGRDSREQSIPSVHVDNTSAAFEAVTYLIQQGHRDIAMLRGAAGDISAGNQRFLGYEQALKAAQLPLRPELVLESGLSVEDGTTSMRKLYLSGPLPSAVFCATDRMAIGAMNFLTENGVKVPEQVSFFGFDDIDMAAIIRPKLSTVRYSASELGMVAARNLIKLIKGEELAAVHWSISHQLEIRDSIARLVKR
ncbi:LacI family DNA-binding transcriptional regulator [Paenibacillus rhizophilus]|uniref:LacI family transcriptional regulator n=1 Tax=Paenibacillus rhizophilus TaxID=1850366 RepID=A0A3N9P681_9BACL|nr:LacI family DNA-binding transcriptional regulator [Paenibacillus rhizophilus]RQW11731.1 LacI family transcriptional regulator [Paenibacillus rhizophilus]